MKAILADIYVFTVTGIIWVFRVIKAVLCALLSTGCDNDKVESFMDSI